MEGGTREYPSRWDAHKQQELAVMLKLGFLGYGEVGYFMSKGFGLDALAGIRAFDVGLLQEDAYKQTILERGKDAGVVFTSSLEELMRGCNVIVAAVPSRFNKDLALNALQYMSKDILYVDLSSSAPSLKEELAAEFSKKGFRYVDGVILEGPPAKMHKVLMYCSGDGAKDWIELTKPYNTRCELLDGPAGFAAKVKIVRSAFMKGFEALCIESFLFARKCKIEQRIMDSLSAVFDNEAFESVVTRMMCTNTVHSKRRALEAEDSVDLMNAEGVVPTMCKTTVERLHKTGDLGLREDLRGIPPTDLETLYSLWESKHYV